ncbi:MAG: Fis family transcriptional regulator, partial [Deltaproteobacteria bacterium]|nr:Fis family transcriptional regulator [Deltaproteobacteria bacterium]
MRELENIIEHATVLCRGRLIESQHLPDYLQPAPSLKEGKTQESVSSKRTKWDDLERGFLLQVLGDHNWNRQAAARELGIGRQTLWRKVKRLNIQVPKKDSKTSKSKKGEGST